VFGYSRRAWAWGNGFYGQTNIPKGLSNCVAIASGVNHSLALTTKGIVRGWGNTSYNESTPPVGLSNVVAIAAAVIHSAAITSNHTVVAWGNGTFGETNVPPTLSNVVSVAVGSAHMLALKSDGTVVHWGYSWPTLTNIPPSATNIVAVAAGDNVSIALRDDGRVVAWGNNVVTNLPANLSDVVAISARSSSCIALKRDGTVTVWGTTISNAPPTLTNIVAISAGLQGMAIDNAALVQVWGYQFSSMMNVPTGLTNTIAIAAGDVHAAALGNNVAPVAASQIVNSVANTESVIALSATDINNDICTLRITSLPASGTLFQYATDGHGSPITAIDTKVTDASNRVVFASQTDAFGTPYDAFQFVANDATVDSGPAVITINVAANPLAYTEPATLITASNALLNAMVVPRLPTTAWFEWGNDTNYGQPSATFALNASSRCVFITNVISGLTALQPYHFRCVASNAAGISYGPDQFFAFGRRLSGFSDFTNISSVTMYPPTGLSNIVAAAAGASHALVLTSDGRVIIWANSNAVNGQTNFTSPLTNVIAIAAAPHSSMVLYKNGTVATAPFSVVPSSVTNVCSIACGESHYMALRRDGTVVCWGGNTYGQTNVPSTLSNVVAIAAGYGRSTALRADTTVVAWGGGYNGSSSVPPPAGLTNVVAIACGGDNTLALKSDGTVFGWGFNERGPLVNAPPAVAIAVSGQPNTGYTFIVANDGTLWRVGTTTSTNLYMVPYPGYSNITAICDGPSFGFVLSDNIAPVAYSDYSTITPANNLIIPLTFIASDVNGDAFTTRITSLPSAGTLYFTNVGQPAQPITATNTVVSYPGALGYAPSTFGGPNESFTFSYVVNDGQYESGPGTFTIEVRTNLQALTYPATSITSSDAILNGAVVANVTPTGAWFEFGTNLATFKTNEAVLVQAAVNAIPWSTTVSNLSPLTTYFYRTVATNSTGTKIGALLSFTTSVPPVQLSSATVVGSSLKINFTGLSNATYTVLSAPDPAGTWSWEGNAVQIAPGIFQFSAGIWDGQRLRFYKVQYP
jgi:alpha-tubulin suppressor-like RCC1 family protein